MICIAILYAMNYDGWHGQENTVLVYKAECIEIKLWKCQGLFPSPVHAERIHFICGHGNLICHYPRGTLKTDIHKDLSQQVSKKLLKSPCERIFNQ